MGGTAAEIEEIVLQFTGPMGAKRIFDTGAESPALTSLAGADVESHDRNDKAIARSSTMDVETLLRPRDTALCVQQRGARHAANTACYTSYPIDMGVEDHRVSAALGTACAGCTRVYPCPTNVPLDANYYLLNLIVRSQLNASKKSAERSAAWVVTDDVGCKEGVLEILPLARAEASSSVAAEVDQIPLHENTGS